MEDVGVEVSAVEAENTRLSSGHGPALPLGRGLQGGTLVSRRSMECPLWSLPAAAALLLLTGLIFLLPNHPGVRGFIFLEAGASLKIL